MEQETQEQTNKFNNKIYYILPEFSGKLLCATTKSQVSNLTIGGRFLLNITIEYILQLTFDELLALPLHLRYNRKVRVRPIACGDKNEYIVLWIE